MSHWNAHSHGISYDSAAAADSDSDCAAPDYDFDADYDDDNPPLMCGNPFARATTSTPRRPNCPRSCHVPSGTSECPASESTWSATLATA